MFKWLWSKQLRTEMQMSSNKVRMTLHSFSTFFSCPMLKKMAVSVINTYFPVSVQLLSRVRLFVTPWTAARQASLSITNSQSLLKLMSIESVVISSSVISFSSCLQSSPTSGSFPMNQLSASGGQSIGVSASPSVLPMNT